MDEIQGQVKDETATFEKCIKEFLLLIIYLKLSAFIGEVLQNLYTNQQHLLKKNYVAFKV